MFVSDEIRALVAKDMLASSVAGKFKLLLVRT